MLAGTSEELVGTSEELAGTFVVLVETASVPDLLAASSPMKVARPLPQKPQVLNKQTVARWSNSRIVVLHTHPALVVGTSEELVGKFALPAETAWVH